MLCICKLQRSKVAPQRRIRYDEGLGQSVMLRNGFRLTDNDGGNWPRIKEKVQVVEA